LKIALAGPPGRTRAVHDMMREADVLASLTHLGIPRLFDRGLLEDGRPWVAIELVKGIELARLIQRESISVPQVIEILVSVAGVLVAAHLAGIVHGDLKTWTILLAPEDPRYPLRVTDWDNAQSLGGKRSMEDAIAGTPTYMAPERARGEPMSEQ